MADEIINEATIRLLQQQEKLLENAKKSLDDIKQKLNDQVEIEKRINEEQQKANNLERDQIVNTEKALLQKQEIVKLREQEINKLREIETKNKSNINIIQAQIDYLTAIGKIGAKQKEQLEKHIEKLQIQNVSLIEQGKISINALNTAKKQANLQKLQQDGLKSIIHHLGFTADVSESWLGKTEQVLSSSIAIGGTLSNVGRTLGSFLNPTNLFSNAIDLIAEQTLAMAYRMDTALASFNKVTGAGGKYNEMIDQVRFGSLAACVGIDEATGAFQSLYLNMNSFTQMSKDAQLEITTTTAILDRMGISSDTVSKSFNLMTKSLNMGVSEAMNAQKEIAATALELGVSPQKLADDFLSSIPSLSQYGKQATNIFKELATQSKATGIAINDLVNISQQFDTFEGAATSAGKLNALLGGNLVNSIDLLAASEAERIDILRDSISFSGKNWQEMNKFEKMAIANAAGIKDMAAANQLFGVSAAEFDKTRKAQDAYALSIKSITEHAKNATAAQEKFGKILEALTGMALPLLKVITYLLDKILAFSDMLGGWLAPALLVITGTLYLVAKALLLVKAVSIATGAAVSLAFWPVAGIVLGIMALIGVLYLAEKRFNILTDWVKFLSEKFLNFWNILLDGVNILSLTIDWVKELWANFMFVEALTISFNAVKDVIINTFNDVKNSITSIIDGMKSMFSAKYRTPIN